MPNSTQLPRQWQIVNFILESKPTHPLGMIFDALDLVEFLLLKILWNDMNVKVKDSKILSYL